MRNDGRLVVVSGPSGVGKTTVCGRLLEYPGFQRVVTCTTRPPREGEIDGEHYHFLTKEEFQRRIKEKELLEYAEVHGQHYGTPRKTVEKGLLEGKYMLLNIDVQGAAQVRASLEAKGGSGSDNQGGALKNTKVTTVFLLPPTEAELEQRLSGRGSDSEEEIRGRLETAKKELREKDKYDHQVVNAALEDAVRDILACVEYSPRKVG